MIRPVSVLIVLAVLVSAICSGCASSGYRKAETAASEMLNLRGNLQSMSEDLGGIQDALQRVIKPTDTGTQTAFEDFEGRYEDLKKRGAAADENLQAVKRHGKSYFESWRKQIATIQNDELREEALKRHDALLSAQKELIQAMEAVRPEREAMMNSLKDLHVYLSNDLSAAGVDSASSSVRRVDQEAVALRDRFEGVMRLIDRTSPGFKPAVPPTVK